MRCTIDIFFRSNVSIINALRLCSYIRAKYFICCEFGDETIEGCREYFEKRIVRNVSIIIFWAMNDTCAKYFKLYMLIWCRFEKVMIKRIINILWLFWKNRENVSIIFEVMSDTCAKFVIQVNLNLGMKW